MHVFFVGKRRFPGNTYAFPQENVSFFDIINDQQKLISLYDDNDILILPSYTEGYPMVVLEALSRLRPVIIFKEIKHIIEDKKGIFVADRNYDSLIKTINFIKANYYSIQEDMKQNNLPSNESFITEIKDRRFKSRLKASTKSSYTDIE